MNRDTCTTMKPSSEEGAQELLNRARKERERRERERCFTHAAIVIQSVYRGHCVRRHEYDMLRRKFDVTELNSASTIHSWTHHLLLFYNHHRDHDRLIRLGHLWLTLRAELIPLVVTDGRVLTSLQCLLVLLCDSLYRFPDQPLATPLRVMEEFGDAANYPAQYRQSILTSIYSHLLSRGYYRTLRRVLEVRVPPPDEPVVHTHHPYAKSLLHLCVHPLTVIGTRAIQWVISELITGPVSPHLTYLILPALSQHTTIQELISNAASINNTALPQATSSPSQATSSPSQATSSPSQATSSPSQASIVTTSSLSPETLYCILLLVGDTVLPAHTVIQLVRIVADVLSLTPVVTASSSDDTEEEEEEESMEVDSHVLLSGVPPDMLSFVVDGQLAKLILSQTESMSAELTDVLSLLCYVIMERIPAVQTTALFRSLALFPQLLQHLWSSITDMKTHSTSGEPLACLQQLCRGMSPPSNKMTTLWQHLSTFSVLLSISLNNLHDEELLTHSLFTVDTLGYIATTLRDVFVAVHTTELSDKLQHTATKHMRIVLCQLHDRSSRVDLPPIEKWSCRPLTKIPLELFLVDAGDDKPHPPQSVPHAARKQGELLREVPFVFPFKERVAYFQRLIAHDKMLVQGTLQDFLVGRALHVKARRNHLYEDAYSELATADLRQKLRVNLVNPHGLDEAGVDGGGLFREFLAETLKTGLEPNRGFFVSTADENLYPNPHVHCVSSDSGMHYRFLGALLGKALYENLMVDLSFSPFFLRKLTVGGDGAVDMHHLSSLDRDLYYQLLLLKHYDGNFDDLSLDFTVITNAFDYVKTVPLKPDGENTPVTSSNRMEFIKCFADFHLNTKISEQFLAFREGLHSVIPAQWLTLFDQHELQVLISGAQVAINVEDLKNNTLYYGELASADHECIQRFWQVVEKMDQAQRSLLLKFVTSCSHPPLLGFAELHPQFSVQLVSNTDHLPTASTCMHLLKLPMFPDLETMTDKLIYAISSGAGFELS